MAGFSTKDVLVLLVGLAIVAVPMARILRRAGWSAWWVVLAFLPPFNFLLLWVFAFARWPAVDAAQAPAAQTGPAA